MCLRLSAAAEALLLGRDGEAQPRIAEQLPADEVRVAAVVRIAERALERVAQHELEERADDGVNPVARSARRR